MYPLQIVSLAPCTFKEPKMPKESNEDGRVRVGGGIKRNAETPTKAYLHTEYIDDRGRVIGEHLRRRAANRISSPYRQQKYPDSAGK